MHRSLYIFFSHTNTHSGCIEMVKKRGGQGANSAVAPKKSNQGNKFRSCNHECGRKLLVHNKADKKKDVSAYAHGGL